MTDRTDRNRAGKGGKKGPSKPGKSTAAKGKAPKREGKSAERKPLGEEETKRPRSTRAGKRPPAAGREGYDGPVFERRKPNARPGGERSASSRTGPRSGGEGYQGRPAGTRATEDRPGSDRGASAGTGKRPSSAGRGSKSEGPRRPGMGGRPQRDAPRSTGSARPSERSAGPREGERPFRESSGGPRTERPYAKGPGSSDRPRSSGPREGARGGDRPFREGSGGPRTERPYAKGPGGSDRPRSTRPPGRDERSGERSERPAFDGPPKNFGGRSTRKATRPKRNLGTGGEAAPDGLMRLNRYLSQSGVASRREADDLIKAGVVSVNGVIVTELGTKVYPSDKVHYGGQRLSMEKLRYVLLNKPKDFITTTDDPRDRRTVMHLIAQACTERLYPVGRLDRHTTGVLLMTNDGDLAKKLTHPSHGAEKLYHATLDKAVTKAHLMQLVEGLELEDGLAQADEAAYVDESARKEVGIKLHMGRNRIVRRMFAALGYEVVKLDRVVFAGLTKKDMPRGKWRHLTEKEILFLKKRK